MTMPDPKKVERVIRQAAFHMRAHSDRKGNVIESNASQIIVGGDLHGNVANFKSLVEVAQLASFPDRMLVLQELIHGAGRYPNGGDHSHRVLDLAASLVCQFPKQVILLPGNHELSELTGRSIMKDSVGLNQLFALGLEFAYRESSGDVRDAYLELFRSLPLAVRTKNRVMIVHTIPSSKASETFDRTVFDRQGLPLEWAERGQSLYSILWGRDHSEENAIHFCKLVDVDWLVCGHIATPEGLNFPCRPMMVLDCVGFPAGHAILDTKITFDEHTFRQCGRILPQPASG